MILINDVNKGKVCLVDNYCRETGDLLSKKCLPIMTRSKIS